MRNMDEMTKGKIVNSALIVNKKIYHQVELGR